MIAIDYQSRPITETRRSALPAHDLQPAGFLQDLKAPEIKLLREPIRINGKWFLPATPGQSEQLDLYWAEAGEAR